MLWINGPAAQAQDLGTHPSTRLLKSNDGYLYGVNSTGGGSRNGTVFRFDPTGNAINVVYTFHGSDGSRPGTGTSPGMGLIEGTDGNLYGTTYQGGSGNQGTVFRLTKAGVLTTLVNFNGTNGGFPYSLIQASDGNFYGTTGTTLFRVTTNGAFSTLLTLTSGQGFSAGVIEASDGNFYGATATGNAPSFSGTVVRMTKSGALTTLASFSGISDGGLIQASDGNLYGTIGEPAPGSVFKLTTGGMFSTLVSFSGQSSNNPLAGVFEASDGNLYGTTDSLSTYGAGAVFRLTKAGALTLLAGLPTNTQDILPSGVVEATNGILYGVTNDGGANNTGSVFSVTKSGTLTILVSFGPSPGGPVEGSGSPAMPNWALVLLASLIVLVGLRSFSQNSPCYK